MSQLGQKRRLSDVGMSASPRLRTYDCDAPNRRLGPLTSDLRLDAPQQSLLRYSMRPAALYAI